MDPDGKDEKGYSSPWIPSMPASRTGAIVQGSSARMASGCKDTPVDAAIVGIVDQVSQD